MRASYRAKFKNSSGMTQSCPALLRLRHLVSILHTTVHTTVRLVSCHNGVLSFGSALRLYGYRRLDDGSIFSHDRSGTATRNCVENFVKADSNNAAIMNVKEFLVLFLELERIKTSCTAEHSTMYFTIARTACFNQPINLLTSCLT
jgi:hypothetical protein